MVSRNRDAYFLDGSIFGSKQHMNTFESALESSWKYIFSKSEKWSAVLTPFCNLKRYFWTSSGPFLVIFRSFCSFCPRSIFRQHLLTKYWQNVSDQKGGVFSFLTPCRMASYDVSLRRHHIFNIWQNWWFLLVLAYFWIQKQFLVQK